MSPALKPDHGKTPHKLDVCECGDYRRDHKDGTGICTFSDGNLHGDGHGGAGRCVRFRLFTAYASEPPQP